MTVSQQLSDQAVQDLKLGSQGHSQAPLTMARTAAGMQCGSHGCSWGPAPVFHGG